MQSREVELLLGPMGSSYSSRLALVYALVVLVKELWSRV